MQETDGSLIARWAWTLEHLLHSCLFLLHTFVTSLQLSFSLSAVFISLLNERRRKKRGRKCYLASVQVVDCGHTTVWLSTQLNGTESWRVVFCLHSCVTWDILLRLWAEHLKPFWNRQYIPPLWNRPKLTTTQQHPQADIHTSTEPLAWQLKYFHSKPAVWSVKPSRADVASYTVCCFVFLLVQTLYKSSA